MDYTEFTEAERVLSLRQLEILVGLRKTAIYGAIKNDGFPPPIKLTARKSGWLISEIQSWLERKRNERDRGPDALA